ncbi:AAA family ATPase [Pontiellaceae bacterium B12219]|nr:AAA family ATPase [Pontiellaceae bacterium B12219]
MRTFISGEDILFAQLEQRAQGICVRYRSQEMPPGSFPEAADIGFEIDTDTGLSTLYVSRGVQYMGDSDQVRNWLSVGSRQFESFNALKTWIQTELANAYSLSSCMADPLIQQLDFIRNTNASNTMTDFSAVYAALNRGSTNPAPDENRLFDSVSEKVIGQDFALKGMCATVARHCARSEPSRPAVIFATGPTGVGKTRAALVLSEVLSNHSSGRTGYGFLRLDMAEYQEAHRISQLIGSPQGYTGHEEGSQLVDALSRNPHTVILFDEIEKAHPSILRVLMNAMDAGRLSSACRTASGHEIDCRRTIFIFTSNLMSREIIEELTESNSLTDQAVVNEVCRKQFQTAGMLPEIIGRIGKFLVFCPLSTEDRVKILTMAISEVAQEYGLDVQYVAPEIVIRLMNQNSTNNLGARPERYLIDDLLGGVFARASHANIDFSIAVFEEPLRCIPMASLETKQETEPSPDHC